MDDATTNASQTAMTAWRLILRASGSMDGVDGLFHSIQELFAGRASQGSKLEPTLVLPPVPPEEDGEEPAFRIQLDGWCVGGLQPLIEGHDLEIDDDVDYQAFCCSTSQGMFEELVQGSDGKPVLKRAPFRIIPFGLLDGEDEAAALRRYRKDLGFIWLSRRSFGDKGLILSGAWDPISGSLRWKASLRWDDEVDAVQRS